MSTATGNSQKPFIIPRLLDAPRDIVFRAWTELEHMEWWGPTGVSIEVRKLELHPGGVFHYCMHTPDGGTMWGKWAIREIVKPGKLVFVNSFSDENEGITQHPMSPTWPPEILSTITFEEQGDKTLLTVTWIPLDATELENKTFDDGHDSMQKGWSGTLDKLAEYLAKK